MLTNAKHKYRLRVYLNFKTAIKLFFLRVLKLKLKRLQAHLDQINTMLQHAPLCDLCSHLVKNIAVLCATGNITNHTPLNIPPLKLHQDSHLYFKFHIWTSLSFTKLQNLSVRPYYVDLFLLHATSITSNDYKTQRLYYILLFQDSMQRSDSQQYLNKSVVHPFDLG